MTDTNSKLRFVCLLKLQKELNQFLERIDSQGYKKVKSKKSINKLTDKIKSLSDRILYEISILTHFDFEQVIQENPSINNRKIIQRISGL